jgi:hypothetical protein
MEAKMGLLTGLKRMVIAAGVLMGLGLAAMLAIPEGDAGRAGTAVAGLSPERQMIERLREMAHAPAHVEAMAVAMAPLPRAEPEALPAPAEAAAEVVRRRVNASALNLREGPSSSTPVMAALTEGTEVEVAESHDSWVRVVGPDGRSGWVFAKYLG